jgi:hypothetical protein
VDQLPKEELIIALPWLSEICGSLVEWMALRNFKIYGIGARRKDGEK